MKAPDLLSDYKLLIIVGHSEYWSRTCELILRNIFTEGETSPFSRGILVGGRHGSRMMTGPSSATRTLLTTCNRRARIHLDNTSGLGLSTFHIRVERRSAFALWSAGMIRKLRLTATGQTRRHAVFILEVFIWEVLRDARPQPSYMPFGPAIARSPKRDRLRSELSLRPGVGGRLTSPFPNRSFPIAFGTQTASLVGFSMERI